MSSRPHVPSLDDHYCQVCSTSPGASAKHLSCFSCDHCRLSMCYECFEKHTGQLISEYTQIQKQFVQLNNRFEEKRQSLGQFQDHCLKSVNAAFEETINDLQKLRQETLDYVRNQFNDAEAVIAEMLTNVRPLIAKSQQNWSQSGITKNVMLELEIQRKQISDVEQRLEIFSSPTMQLSMSTYPRNRLELQCQFLSRAYLTAKKFSAVSPGKSISTRCSYAKSADKKTDKIDVETEVEDLRSNSLSTKQSQTEPLFNHLNHTDHEEDDEDGDHLSGESPAEQSDASPSARFAAHGTILTQNEVDRLASNGEHLLYFSDTSKSLCYITDILSTRQANGTSTTKEISCRWPYHPILDLVYSPVSGQFVAATKIGVYTVTVEKASIDIQMQLTQHWTYVRLAADRNFIWLWTDTPRASQLRTYSPQTFDCVKIFNLHDYPRFADNSTSFCIYSNLLATLFQFKQSANLLAQRKIFHLTLADSTSLQELCTIRLGPCEIDHEIRVNYEGLFFITNGKKKLWIVDQHGKKEYVRLYRTGRALTIHKKNHIIIANGTQQLQCVEVADDTQEPYPD